MTSTGWLYRVNEALDSIADQALRAHDDIPNIQEWVEEIKRKEREQCVVECNKLESMYRKRARKHSSDFDDGTAAGCAVCAVAILKLGEQDGEG